jgi:hypothetical protein
LSSFVRNRLGDKLLLRVAQARIVVAAINTHEHVRQLVTEHVDLRVDRCSELIVNSFAAGSHEPPCPLASVR